MSMGLFQRVSKKYFPSGNQKIPGIPRKRLQNCFILSQMVTILQATHWQVTARRKSMRYLQEGAKMCFVFLFTFLGESSIQVAFPTILLFSGKITFNKRDSVIYAKVPTEVIHNKLPHLCFWIYFHLIGILIHEKWHSWQPAMKRHLVPITGCLCLPCILDLLFATHCHSRLQSIFLKSDRGLFFLNSL